MLKAFRKKAFIARSSLQGLAAKAKLIEKGKGRNGKSMSQQLTERHFGIV